MKQENAVRMDNAPSNYTPDSADIVRRYGYLQASLDPLGQLSKVAHPLLDTLNDETATKLKKIYCGSIGLETSHIADPTVLSWFASRLEAEAPSTDSKFLLKRLAQAELFEKFLHTRYVGAKRFSLEGVAALIPLFDSLLDSLVRGGAEMAIIGMAHRGRLTSLWSVIGTAPKNIFACFEDVDPHSVFGSGDVKYHLGATGTYQTKSGKSIQVRIASNPSHLEAVNPVIMGRVRAHQERLGEGSQKKVVAIIVHGDAALAGQGITAECLNLQSINGFSIGGTIHINANNLIGFTAPFQSTNSSLFSTDIAKRLPIPIIHVNAEEVDAVWNVGQICGDYRQEFGTDVFIDLIGYRRFGHNEGDDPTFTSPALYAKIEKLAPAYVNYASKKGIPEAEIKNLEQEIITSLTTERDAAQAMTTKPKMFKLPEYWDNYIGGEYSSSYEVDTGVSEEILAAVTNCITTVPSSFTVHPKLQKLLEQRKEMGTGKKPIDWGMAEQLAMGSLLLEGSPVRISGQDSRRATFNQRHAVYYDHKTGSEYIPLSTISKSKFQVYDSILSEAAVMGFEYGYSRDYPETLVCWEAQFGDFVNGAQIIIDQFLSSAEDKWKLLSGLTLLLPHGFEGQGPEHSSARLERFLQLCAEDNMQVVQPSNAAQYFHLLRRQVRRKWRKPLIVMTPKSMLRLPAATSPLSEFTSGRFKNVIGDDTAYDSASRVIICSGKIVHELRTERTKRETKDTAIITLEQLYPFPETELAEELSRYENVKNVIWVQEEPANMGALFFVRPYLDQLADRGTVSTVRRSASASPATGSAKAHELEQKALIHLAFAGSK